MRDRIVADMFQPCGLSVDTSVYVLVVVGTAMGHLKIADTNQQAHVMPDSIS